MFGATLKGASWAWASFFVWAGGACPPLLEIRFDRPAAARPADPASYGLKIDLAEVAWRDDAAAEARAALAPFAALARADLNAQRRAFGLLFAWADLAAAAGLVGHDAGELVRRLTLRPETELEAAAAAVAQPLVEAGVAARARRNSADEVARLKVDLARAPLRISGDLIADDPSTGAPDHATYAFIRGLERRSPGLRTADAKTRARFARLRAIRRRSYAAAWDDPHVRALSAITYTEPVPRGFVDRPVREFIEAKRYLHPFWWESFARFAELRDLADGRPAAPPARITADTSRSPLRYILGADAERRIYWPARREGALVTPELSRFRVAENRVGGRVESVEVLVNAGPGAPPLGYLFVDIDGELVPARIFKRRPVAESCLGCHAEARDGRRGRFLPFFLESPADLIAVGYKNRHVIEALLAPH